MAKHMYIQINLRRKEAGSVELIEGFGGEAILVSSQTKAVEDMLTRHHVYRDFDVAIVTDLIDESQGGHE